MNNSGYDNVYFCKQKVIKWKCIRNQNDYSLWYNPVFDTCRRKKAENAAITAFSAFILLKVRYLFRGFGHFKIFFIFFVGRIW